MHYILPCSLFFDSGQRGKNQCSVMRCNQAKDSRVYTVVKIQLSSD